MFMIPLGMLHNLLRLALGDYAPSLRFLKLYIEPRLWAVTDLSLWSILNCIVQLLKYNHSAAALLLVVRLDPLWCVAC